MAPATPNGAVSGRKPNIIFVLSDDLSWGDLGCYGQTKIKTPNIDRLADEGIRFTQCYAGNSVCAPSRSCLMEGLHPGHARVRGNGYRGYRHSLQPEDTTVAEVLKDAGYATGLFGKWGLALSDQPGIPRRKGFDEFRGYLNQRKAHNYYPPFLWCNEEKVHFPQHEGFRYKEQSPYDEAGNVMPVGMKDPAKAVYSFDYYSEASLEFVRAHQDVPFFLYLAYTIPHGVLVAPNLGPYADQDWPSLRHREWAAMITRMDDEVGNILDLIAELELDEDTIIFFASDNGYSAYGYDHDAAGPSFEEFFDNMGPTKGRKGGSDDGSFRVPCMARWPERIKPGQVSDLIWAFWDFLPTAAELAGVSTPVGRDGLSILPTLLGKAEDQQEHEFLYWEFGQAQAVRMDNWYARRPSGGTTELYDILQDPDQAADLAAQHSDVVARVEEIFEQSHRPSEVWPSPGESQEAYAQRLTDMGIAPWPENIDG